MVHFVSPFRVPLLLCTILIASSGSGNIKGNLSDARIISSFLEKIIKPYIENNQNLEEKPRWRASYRITENIILKEVENVIKLKVIQFEPMLQDKEENTENKPKLPEKAEADDETTILEFVPKNNRRTKLKSELRQTNQETVKNIEKYKQLIQNIALRLSKEKTSNLTNKLITRTLEEMLSLLKEGQCNWNSVDTRDLMKHILKNTRKSMENLTDKELDQYKLTCYMKRRNKDGKPGYSDEPGYSKYGRQKSSRNFDQDNEISNKNKCESFIVCSDELRHFLKITYKHLNDTTVSTFTNYAAMYIRDIKEKTAPVNDEITSILYGLSKSAEANVNEVFIKELEHFTLDKNKDKAANIEHITNFITVTTDHIKSNLSQLVHDKMIASESKFILTIKNDLIVNLGMDLDNLKHRFVNKICEFFVLCNGINTHDTSELNKPQVFKSDDHENVDPENVYVKVQVSFDDELKNSLVRLGEQNLNSWPADATYRFGKRLMDAIGLRKYNYVNVTRTTISSISTTDDMFSSENGLADQFF